MTQNKEQREFLRAYNNVYLQYRVLTDSEETNFFHKLSRENALHENETELCEILRTINIHIEKIKRTEPEIAACLSAIDRKIDLIRTLQNPSHENIKSEEHTHHVNISAGGISFLTKENIKVGKVLELKITLPKSNDVLDIYGTVIHTEYTELDEQETREKLTRTGVKFDHLTESEQDLLVQYSLDKERENISNEGNKLEEDL